MRNIQDDEILLGASEKFSKTGRLFTFTGRQEKMNQNEEISQSDGERLQVCGIVRCDGFSVIYCYKKSVSFFSVATSIHFSLTFSYVILTSYHSLS